jgi:hypothetical protein
MIFLGILPILNTYLKGVFYMIKKRIVCPDRLRLVPPHFSWIDHTLVRKKYISILSHESRSLYLFLVTVCDAEGISYYSDTSLCTYLSIPHKVLVSCREDLCRSGLVAYSKPFYQVLCLQHCLSPAPCETKRLSTQRIKNDNVQHIGKILADCFGGAL